jgi:membrane protein DedA with SNARE-associated domain
LKTLVPVTIGLTKYPVVKFHIINTISAALWALLLGIGSYLAGDLLTRIAAYFSANPLYAPIILLSIIALLWTYLQKATQKKKS